MMNIPAAIVAIAGSSLFVFQLMHLNSFAASWDQVDFALALDRFDLLAMQPHFPGYPYFILGGMLIHTAGFGAVESLVLFNVISYASAVLPIYWLLRRYRNKQDSLAGAMLIYTAPYPLLMVNQPMSEGAAMACMWWLIWSLQKARESDRTLAQLLPLFLFSLLLGIRLSYLLLGVGILFVWYEKWQTGAYRIREIVRYAVLALFFQLIWVGALVVSEGGFVSFIKLALAFTDGHFNDWGNTAVSSEQPVWERAWRLLVDNGLWTGVFFQHLLLLMLYGLLLLRSRFASYGMPFLLLMATCYAAWALFAQNIDKPRHFLPVIVIGLFWLAAASVKKGADWIIVMVIAAQAVIAGQAVYEQFVSSPASYQLSAFLREQASPAVVYTWEEGRVLRYVKTPAVIKEIQTYELFKQDMSYYKDKTIYVTEKVVQGFQAQGYDVSDSLERKEVFVSNPLSDPVYSRIVLYQWKE